MPDYPLAEKMPGQLKTPTGLPFSEITLRAVLDGRITMEDLRVTPEALELQARIAQAAGRRQLAENLRRAAELAAVPEERIREIYNALRPGRGTRAGLLALATDLEERYAAARCAALIREAAESAA
ncbi:MAG: glycerol dehydrogenase [Acidobacteria bacterium]|nr:glycerol dehydrogenase [Acidobacteriota bacterium]